MRHQRCYPHVTGVQPGTPPFFTPGCDRCEEKRRQGLVTGDEPPPVSPSAQRRTYSAKTFTLRMKKDAAARKALRLATPKHQEGRDT